MHSVVVAWKFTFSLWGCQKVQLIVKIKGRSLTASHILNLVTLLGNYFPCHYKQRLFSPFQLAFQAVAIFSFIVKSWVFMSPDTVKNVFLEAISQIKILHHLYFLSILSYYLSIVLLITNAQRLLNLDQSLSPWVIWVFSSLLFN